MWIWRLNSDRRTRSQVQAWSRKLTQCLRDDARRNSPGGHSARSRGKDLPCIVKPTYTGYQIFLHTALQMPNPVCTCLSTSAYMYVCLYMNNSMLPSQYRPFLCIPSLSCHTRAYGLRHRRECAKTPSGRNRATSMGPSTSLRHLLYMYTVGNCLLSQWVMSTLA